MAYFSTVTRSRRWINVWLIADLIHPSFVSTVSPSISIFATRGRRIRPPSTVSNRLFTRRAPSHPPTVSRGLSAFLSSFLFLLLSLGGDRFAQPRSKKEKRFKEETFETREPLGLRSLSPLLSSFTNRPLNSIITPRFSSPLPPYFPSYTVSIPLRIFSPP